MSYFTTGAALTAALNALPTSLTGTYKAFDAFYYAEKYMGSYAGTLTPIEHFVQVGAARGYQPNADFNPAYYQSQYSDLAGFDAAELLYHYVRYGLNEGRPGNATLAANDWSAYLAAYPAVAEYVTANLSSFGGSMTNGAIAHYVKFGQAQGFTLPNTVGQTFMLTAGVDAITGTSGNDAFFSYPNKADGSDATTLNAFDVVNGGEGTDTLNITANTVSSTNFNNTLTGTISGVEIINLDLTAADVPASVDASVGGAALQQLWQIGKAAGVTKLAATTTAGLKGVDLTSAVDVEAAKGAASVAIALDAVKGLSSSGTTTATLTTDGDNLSAVTVSGTIKASDTSGKDKTVLALEIGVGVDAAGAGLKTVTVNSNQTTTLTLATASAVTTVDASGSTGGITFDAGSLTGLASITTGTGKDVIDIDTATVKDNAATAKDETLSGYVSSGAGDDKITATFSGAGKASILAGDGNDTVTIAGLATGGTTADGGAGDDTVDASTVTLTTKVSLAGGEGSDTLAIAGGTTLVTADYLTLTAVASGFETLEFKNATTVDASQVDAQFATLNFNKASSANEVTKLGTQALVLKAGSSLTATTGGYKLDGDTNTAGNQTVYAGTVNATTNVTSAITANAADLSLAIKTSDSKDAAATADGSSVATITGDVETITVALTSTRDTGTVATGSKSTGFENIAGAAIDLDPNTESATVNNTLNALKSVVVTGAGTVSIDARDTTGSTEGSTDTVSGKLTLIDLSGMTAFVQLNAAGDQVTDNAATSTTYGYANLSTSTVTLNNAVSETVKLGGADDTVVTTSTYAKMDTIEGFELVANLVADATGKTADAAKSDAIDVTGSVTFVKYELTSAPTTLAGALLEVGNALDSSSAAIANLVFAYDGNTYVYQDDATAGISASDTLIKLVGTYNLDLLIDVVG